MAAARIGRRAAAGLSLVTVTSLVAAVGWWSRRPPVPPAPRRVGEFPRSLHGQEDGTEPPLPTFTVMIAARNEACVLPALLGDLAGQDYCDEQGRPRFDVLVIDDRSTDDTAEVAEATARVVGLDCSLRVVRRRGEDLPDGKGAALAAVGPTECSGDVIVVLDADARLGPAYLRTLAWYAAQGVSALTGRIRIAPGGGSVERAQADEQVVDGAIQRARWASGGCAEFRGNGIVIDRRVLIAAGGWRPALTEDLDLSARLAVRGTHVAWAIDAVVWAEPVPTLAALWRQRLRWAEGSIRRALEHGPAVVRSTSITGFSRLEFAVYLSQLAVPLAFAGAVVGGARRRRPAAALGLFATYAGALTLLTADALRWEGESGGAAAPRRVARGMRVAALSAIWLAAVPVSLGRIALRRGPVRYAKTDHASRPADAGWGGY